MKENFQDIHQQLCCPIYIYTFQSPITIECGHSFCRSCLLNYTRSKKMCPVCRVSLTQICQHPSQDEVLSGILGLQKEEQGKNGRINNQISVNHFEDLLIIDIKTQQLLLPFTKAVVTFSLANPAMLVKLDRFVARQEAPFHKYAMVSKMNHINQLRFNTYECLIECKSFCEITKEHMEKNCDQTQEYFYRVCEAKIIYEFEHVDPCTLQHFLTYFQSIKDRKLLTKIYKSVDHQNIFSKQNLIACFYSILKIMAKPKQTKYKIAISFDKQQKENYLKEFLNQMTSDGAKNMSTLLEVQTEKKYLRERQLICVFVILVSLFLFWNQEEF